MDGYPLTLLYDEACPLCRLEIDNLKARDRKGLLRFIDISAAGFDVKAYGVTMAALQERIHAVTPDGKMVIGVEVFRRAYQAVGLGWLIRPTGWPVLKPLCDWAYLRLARNRYRIPERIGLLLFGIAARRAEKRSRSCRNGQCDI